MTGGRPGASSGLLERESEARVLQNAVSKAASGSGGLAVVRGVPGIGKSRLIVHTTEIAVTAGLAVTVARGSVLERDFSFGVALQLFEPVLASLAAPERAEVFRGSAALCIPIFSPDPQRVEAGGDRFFSLAHGLYWLTVNLAERTPMVLAVDDAHWSDVASLRFLLYLAQRLDELPVAMITAARPLEPDAPQALLDQLTAHPLGEVLEPAPLSAESSAQIVLDVFPEAETAFCTACYHATGGNPFLLHELLSSVTVGGGATDAAAAANICRLNPPAISRSVLVRLARLPEDCARLARAAVVLGSGAELRVATALARLDGAAAAQALDRLSASHILEPGEPLRFIHPVVETAVATELPHAEAALAHLEAARLLLAEGAPPERVTTHLLRAPATGQAWVVSALRAAAARALAAGQPEPAVKCLERALQEPPDACLRREVLRELGSAGARVGAEAAAGHLEEAAALAEGEERAAMLLEAGRAHFWAGRNLEAARTFDRGLELIPTGDSDIGKELEAAWGAAAALEASLSAEVVPRVGRIIERLGRQSGPVTAAERSLLAQVALIRTWLGDHHDSTLPLARRALDNGRLLSDEGSESITVSVINGVLIWNDAQAESLALMDAGLEDSRRRGSVMGFATCSYCRSFPNLSTGRVLDAIADAQHALDARRYGWEAWVPSACYVLTLAHLAHDDIPAAVEAAALPEAEERWGESATYATLLWARGHLAEAQTRLPEARDLFTRAGAMFDAFRMIGPNVFPWRSDLALVALRLGDRDTAERLAAEELELSHRCGVGRAIGISLRARGIITGGASGIEILEEAAQILGRSPSRLEDLRARVELGAALRREGHRSAAGGPLREAYECCSRIGARALARRAHDELLAAGARPRRSARFGLDALTASEWRVASLAASSGLNNRELAAALFLTPKTIEYHLRNVYSKLELGSRRELARHAADFELGAAGS